MRERGTSTSEYALIVGLVGVAVIAALVLLGQTTSLRFKEALEPFAGKNLQQLLDDFESHSDLDWQYIWGNWHTEDGWLTSGDRWSKAVAALPGADYTFSLDLQTLTSAGNNPWDVSRVVFRFQDTDNYYAIVPKTDGTVELAKMQNGQWRPWLAYANIGVDPMQPHNYKVDVVGNRIQVYVDGQKVVEYEDPSPILSGGVGVTNDWSTGRFDNVNVEIKG